VYSSLYLISTLADEVGENVLCNLFFLKRIANYNGVAQIEILLTTKSVTTICIFSFTYYILLYVATGVENAFSHDIFRRSEENKT
jgi:hypothetical protein